MKLTGENRSTRGETCPSATLATTNPTWTDPGSNPDLRGERPATNRLSHGTALNRTLVSREPCFIPPVKGEASVVSTFPFILETREQNFCL
jgi:hypothetical protein